MATDALVHGAADSGWFWHLLEPELRARATTSWLPTCRVTTTRPGWSATARR
jgi:hypothetical protein